MGASSVAYKAAERGKGWGDRNGEEQCLELLRIVERISIRW